MSETPPSNGAGDSSNGGGPAVDPNAEGAPSLGVMAQYLKDLSFENPRAPNSFADPSNPPQIEIDVNVNARGLGQNRYEVELSVSAHAKRGEDVAFVVETVYAGIFELKNIPQEQLELVMLVECPRLLFPFARQIVADATRNGNFPPLMLEPIDFFAVYHQNKARREAAPQAPAQA